MLSMRQGAKLEHTSAVNDDELVHLPVCTVTTPYKPVRHAHGTAPPFMLHYSLNLATVQ